MAFGGYLVRFTKTNTNFPHAYIAEGGYKVTPQQRTEIKAYRDNSNLLHRVTSPNNKTKIEITTIERLNATQMSGLQSLLKKAMSNTQQRKLSIKYWDEENQAYRTMTAYMADVTYTVDTISSSDIKYKAVTFTFVEY